MTDTDKSTSLMWSTVACLPHSYSDASGIICGDHLYMLGGVGENGLTKSVLTCSLTELLLSSSSSTSVWHRVADAPVYSSTCAVIKGELLAVGGRGDNGKPSSAIYQYNPKTNFWLDLVSNTPTARWRSLVAVLPTNEMMIVGGAIDYIYTKSNEVEVAHFNLS